MTDAIEAAKRIFHRCAQIDSSVPRQRGLVAWGDSFVVARALLASGEREAKMREALTELADAAEHDLKMNQDDDGSGWWSLKNEQAISKARAALAAGQEGSAPGRDAGPV